MLRNEFRRFALAMRAENSVNRVIFGRPASAVDIRLLVVREQGVSEVCGRASENDRSSSRRRRPRRIAARLSKRARTNLTPSGGTKRARRFRPGDANGNKRRFDGIHREKAGAPSRSSVAKTWLETNFRGADFSLLPWPPVQPAGRRLSRTFRGGPSRRDLCFRNIFRCLSCLLRTGRRHSPPAGDIGPPHAPAPSRPAIWRASAAPEPRSDAAWRTPQEPTRLRSQARDPDRLRKARAVRSRIRSGRPFATMTSDDVPRAFGPPARRPARPSCPPSPADPRRNPIIVL